MMKEAHTGGSFVWHQDYGLGVCVVLFPVSCTFVNKNVGTGTTMVVYIQIWAQYSLPLTSVIRKMAA